MSVDQVDRSLGMEQEIRVWRSNYPLSTKHCLSSRQGGARLLEPRTKVPRDICREAREEFLFAPGGSGISRSFP